MEKKYCAYEKMEPLKPGDKVAIISPSAGIPSLFPWVYEQGLKRIREEFFLEPVEFPSALQSPQFLSQNPKMRANDINQAFADPSIKAIIATIGGNDQIRILPYLDQKIIMRYPKPFMGYSDCTNLHLVLWNLGIRSYYGGAVMTQFAMGGGMHPYTVNSIKKALFEPQIGEVYPASERSDIDLDWADHKNLTKKRPFYPSEPWAWHNCQGQKITGKLWGGCLEVLDLHFKVQKYLPSFKQLEGTILFVETSEEMPCSGSVYRFFASLGEMGLLNKFQAILVAYPKAECLGALPLREENLATLCSSDKETYILAQRHAIQNALSDYSATLPVIFNMNFGHTDPQMILPNGGEVTIDTDNKIIILK